MIKYFSRRRWFIAITFLIAYLLEVLPLPGFVFWLRPAWALLVLMYWVMALPEVVGVGYAFIVGILLDVLTGTLLGEHALAMVCVAYIIIKAHRLLRVYPLLQQTFVMFGLMFLYQCILYIVQKIIHQPPTSWLYWIGGMVSTALWPWVFIVLRDWRRRFQIV